MPRPRISTFWRGRVATLLEEGESYRSIEQTVKTEGTKLGQHDYPSYRTIQRLSEAWKARPEHERREQAVCRWPDAMVRGALPWEASATVLELLRHRRENGMGRPTNRLAKWYWRAKLACPGAGWLALNDPAADLADWELAQEHVDVRVLEDEFMYGLPTDDDPAWRAAIAAGHVQDRKGRLIPEGQRGKDYLRNVIGEQAASDMREADARADADTEAVAADRRTVRAKLRAQLHRTKARAAKVARKGGRR